MEIGPAELAVGDALQADVFLERDDRGDRLVLDATQRLGRDLAARLLLARLEQALRAQEAADMVGAKGRGRAGGHGRSLRSGVRRIPGPSPMAPGASGAQTLSMSDEPLRLHVPEPTGRPGRHTDFSYLHLSPAGAVRRPPVDVAAGRHQRPGLRAGARARRRRPRRRPVGAADRRRAAAPRPARDDEDARLRRAHADRAAAEEDLVLHAVPGRGGDRGRARAGAASPATCASRPTGSRACCWRATTSPMVELMCQLLSNERDPLKGRQLPVMYSYKRAGFFSISRQPGHAVHPGGGLGDGLGDQGRHADRLGLDRRRRHRRGRLPHRADLRPRLPGAGDPERRQQPVGDLDLPGDRRRRGARPSRRAASAAASPRCASTATTSSRSTRPRAGPPSARAATSGRR